MKKKKGFRHAYEKTVSLETKVKIEEKGNTQLLSKKTNVLLTNGSLAFISWMSLLKKKKRKTNALSINKFSFSPPPKCYALQSRAEISQS